MFETIILKQLKQLYNKNVYDNSDSCTVSIPNYDLIIDVSHGSNIGYEIYDTNNELVFLCRCTEFETFDFFEYDMSHNELTKLLNLFLAVSTN